MKKLFISLICGAVTLGALGASAGSAFALSVDEGASAARPEIITTSENPVSEDAPTEIAPTFSTTLNESERSINFKFGHNVLLTGNNLTSEVSNKSGFLFSIGNNLALRTSAEYNFLLGNTITYAGETTRDLYLMGNIVTLAHDATLGRDVFAAANTLTIDTDITGDLSVTADTVVLKNTKIAGNLNLTVDHLEVVGKVEVAGSFVYNDDADITGLANIKAGSTETYHVEEVDQTALFVASIYSKIMSAIGLFIVMALICAFYPRLHEKIETEATIGRFGTNLALGLGLLIAVPVIAIFAFFTLIAAPLGIIALVFYCIAIYLAKGFAGAWLGHVIIEKLFKAKGNVFIETLLGIIVLSLCSLVPYLGVITGFLGLLFGFGLVFDCLKPVKKGNTKKVATKAAKG